MRIANSVRGRHAETGHLPYEPFGQRPHEPRPVEGLVVEACREEEGKAVDSSREVEVHAWDTVLPLDPHVPLEQGLARAQIGHSVDTHETVGARAGHAEQAAGPVVFEGPAGHDHSRGSDRRRDGVAREPQHVAAVQPEADRTFAVDRFPGPRSEPVAHRPLRAVSSGQKLSWNRLVRVSLRARNQLRQPSR